MFLFCLSIKECVWLWQILRRESVRHNTRVEQQGRVRKFRSAGTLPSIRYQTKQMAICTPFICVEKKISRPLSKWLKKCYCRAYCFPFISNLIRSINIVSLEYSILFRTTTTSYWHRFGNNFLLFSFHSKRRWLIRIDFKTVMDF